MSRIVLLTPTYEFFNIRIFMNWLHARVEHTDSHHEFNNTHRHPSLDHKNPIENREYALRALNAYYFDRKFHIEKSWLRIV